MNEALAKLVDTFKDDRPVVLFLGQDAWSHAGESDSVLEMLFERLKGRSDCSRGWSGILGSEALTELDAGWIAERFARNVPSEAMQSLYDFSWSAVFTSTIDPRLSRRFDTMGRQPESVLSSAHVPKVPRSRSRPPIIHLYGVANGGTHDSCAPKSKRELLQRFATHTNLLLNRIPDTVTAAGLFVIEGYVPGSDWLRLDELLAPLSVEPGTLILWFGAPDTVESDLYGELSSSGKLLASPDRLVDLLPELRVSGLDQLAQSTSRDQPGIVSLHGEAFLDVAPSLRLRVEASSAIVDDSWTGFLAPLDGESERESFRRFHGDFGGPRDLFEGIKREFAIRRDFESDLRRAVESQFRDPSGTWKSVVLHGQSATGKSIAIARLASALRNELHAPVLYAVGRIPQTTDIEPFCLECEKVGAVATVILCDCNQPVVRYQDLAAALRSRGRRSIIVGTTYRSEEPARDKATVLVEASTDVSDREWNDLQLLVKRFGYLDSEVMKAVGSDRSSLLPLLYRLFFVGREKIASSIADEARAAETQLRQRARTVPLARHGRSAIAEQLIALKLTDQTTPLFGIDQESEFRGDDAAGVLIDFVMAAGRLNCPIPVNLLLRVVCEKRTSIDIGQIGYLFGDLDLFRWRNADAEGNELLIAPRLRFEAELICRKRFADRERELECIISLIRATRPRLIDGSAEITFLLDLLYALDRKGPRGDEYAYGFLRIAEALTHLRLNNGVLDASVMLQESNFRRAALLFDDRSGNESVQMSDIHRAKILDDAREVVETALADIRSNRLHAGRRTIESLRVERASIYGYLAVGKARAGAHEDEVWANYLAARNAISLASTTSNNLFSLDVALWTPSDILTHGGLSEARAAELEADIYNAMDQIDPAALSSTQAQRFQERRLKVGRAIGDQGLSESAYQALVETNPSVAYYHRAREMASPLFDSEEVSLSHTALDLAQAAADFLTVHSQGISGDSRTLYLLLQLKWATASRYRLLRGDRRPIPSRRGDREQLLAIVRELNQLEGEGVRFSMRYLEATLSWCLGDITHATALARNLSRDTAYEDPSRVNRRLFIADEAGKAVMFRGRVGRERSAGHWELNVEDLRAPVDLLERDFRDEELRPGRELRNFAISFNYLGPIADPATRFGAGG